MSATIANGRRAGALPAAKPGKWRRERAGGGETPPPRRAQSVYRVYGVGRVLGTPRAALLNGVQLTVATEEHVL